MKKLLIVVLLVTSFELCKTSNAYAGDDPVLDYLTKDRTSNAFARGLAAGNQYQPVPIDPFGWERAEQQRKIQRLQQENLELQNRRLREQQFELPNRQLNCITIGNYTTCN